MSEFKAGDKVKFKDIKEMFELCDGNDIIDIETFVCFGEKIKDSIDNVYTVSSILKHNEVRLHENSWIVPIKYLEKVEPPNYRENSTCIDCKYYTYKYKEYHIDYICKKYDILIDIYHICDDFEEGNK